MFLQFHIRLWPVVPPFLILENETGCKYVNEFIKLTNTISEKRFLLQLPIEKSHTQKIENNIFY